MKALTLHQPWASLVALGIKTVETRSWRAPDALIGQPLAIHAGARSPATADIEDDHEFDTLGVFQWMRYIGRDRPASWRNEWHYYLDGDGPHPLPLGVVMATCRLAACVPIVHIARVMTDPESVPWPNVQRNGPDVCSLVAEDGLDRDLADQLPYGDFTPGRWAWLLDDVKPTTERCPACWGEDGVVCFRCMGLRGCPPVPAKGRQGLWNWEPR